MDQQNKENTLNADVEIKGNLKFTGSLRLDGKIEGQINSEGRFIVGPQGEVRGDVIVQHAVIEGKVQGNITAKDKVELKSHAQLFGDVKSSRLVIEEGVVMSGKCEINPDGRKIPEPPKGKGAGIAELVEKK